MPTYDLLERLADIERDLEAGTYRPGPWKSFLVETRQRPADERAAVSDAVDRVSDRLFRRKPRFIVPLWIGLIAEVATAVLGGACLAGALALRSNLLAIGAMGLWAAAFEPLVKMGVGTLAGIRYSYAYLWGPEPRFKMRYGTYLAAPRPARILLHLAGCVGSPLAAWLVRRAVKDSLPLAATVCDVALWLLVGTNVITFAASLAGVKKIGPIALAESSGGSAAQELK